MEIGRNKYDVANTLQFGTFDGTRNSDASFLSLNWQISSKHLLTLRNYFIYEFNKNGLVDNSKIYLYESYGNDKNWDNSLLLILRSNLVLQ